MFAQRRWPCSSLLMAVVLALSSILGFADAAIEDSDIRPQYHYGARIPITCLDRSIETGEHIQEGDKLKYVPFATCEETGLPLDLQYGVEADINCTIASVSDSLFHLLEFYIHNDAPLSCRLPARPPATVSLAGTQPPEQEYVPLVFALAGTLQRSHLHVSTHLNILLHSVPKHHLHKHDSGVVDSGAAYSTSPLAASSKDPHLAFPYFANSNHKLIIGDPLPLSFSVRWFPTPALPTTNGRFEWNGMGGHVYASTVFYILVAFGAGVLVCTVYFWGIVLPKRLQARARGMGGATPLGGGYGINSGGLGNGWGMGGGKRID
ncbi:hypothetical protein VE02_05164 [Pseudogymnoascus sp. 03VT05]|nr:hypothetical protein VE02_05164 [Pseudogymnoascus sp. 03VT05]